jgi:hypothetical protein
METLLLQMPCYDLSPGFCSTDVGANRLPYERLGIQEYWVVNAVLSEIIAFEMLNGGSQEIRCSAALSDLEFVEEEVLKLSQITDNREVNCCLLQGFS